jgi:biotin synthase-related radical SAM superfamily protein
VDDEEEVDQACGLLEKEPPLKRLCLVVVDEGNSAKDVEDIITKVRIKNVIRITMIPLFVEFVLHSCI